MLLVNAVFHPLGPSGFQPYLAVIKPQFPNKNANVIGFKSFDKVEVNYAWIHTGLSWQSDWSVVWQICINCSRFTYLSFMGLEMDSKRKYNLCRTKGDPPNGDPPKWSSFDCHILVFFVGWLSFFVDYRQWNFIRSVELNASSSPVPLSSPGTTLMTWAVLSAVFWQRGCVQPLVLPGPWTKLLGEQQHQEMEFLGVHIYFLIQSYLNHTYLLALTGLRHLHL